MRKRTIAIFAALIYFVVCMTGCSSIGKTDISDVGSITEIEQSNIVPEKTESKEQSALSSEAIEQNNKEEKDDMVIILNGQTYSIKLEDNDTLKDILKMLPLTQEFQRYAEHEYYTELPDRPAFDSVEKTSQIKAGHIYYWDGWNAFVINFVDYDITPYKVAHLGEVNGDISEVLAESPETLTIRVE